MIRTLKHLRDFLDEEQMKWLPSNLTVESCILLTQQKKGSSDEVTRTVLQVFDHGGTWIGEVTNPDWIPERK